MSGALVVVGTSSGVGKSTVVAGLCRSWSRSGRSVAPFKAQNMSNHSAVTPDGGEIGRAQASQAAAAGVEPDRRMNPVLLKPGGERHSHLVVMGIEREVVDARGYGAVTGGLRPVVLDAFDSLRRSHDLVVAEGAGGAAEINLLGRDLVNLPLARAAGVPAVLVVDIDRGGAFAAAHGTIDLLPAGLRATLAGIVINRFRGDPTLLAPGIDELERRDGVPVLGVLDHLGDEPLLGAEDALDVAAGPSVAAALPDGATASPRPVRVAAVRLPRLANPSDLDPLVTDPDVELRWVQRPADLGDADLVVLPGSRATVADLAWLRQRGFDEALGRSGSWILGVCAGYQMLGRRIYDEVESGAGSVEGLGLLEVETHFEGPKVVRRSSGSADGHPVEGYQIRWGRPLGTGAPWLCLDGDAEGAVGGHARVRGTSLHGLLDADGFRDAFLGAVADDRGRLHRPGQVRHRDALDAQHERLADWIDARLDSAALATLAATAAPPCAGPGW